MFASCCPSSNFECSFFSSDFSIKRKIAAGTAIAIGVALAIILALGMAEIIPGINALYPILSLTSGTVAFLAIGFALAGCKQGNPVSEIENTQRTMGGETLVAIDESGENPKKDESTTEKEPLTDKKGVPTEEKVPQEGEVVNVLGDKNTNNLTEEEMIDAKLNTSEQIEHDFTKKMVEALGGVDKVRAIPIIRDWSGNTTRRDLKFMKAPVMRGYLQGSVYLLFHYFLLKDGKKQRCMEYVGRLPVNNLEGWKGLVGRLGDSEITLRCWGNIYDNTLAERYMLNKIARLVKGEPVGAVKKYEVDSAKPTDKSTWRPKDAYFKDKELDEFMEINTNYYEGEPTICNTAVFLCDPKSSKEDIAELIKSRFPNHRITESKDQIKIDVTISDNQR